jgi:hypothetical protein
MSWTRLILEAEFLATTPVGNPAIMALESEVVAAALGQQLLNQAFPGKSTEWNNLTTGARVLAMHFVAELSGPDKTALDGIIAAHLGNSLPPSTLDDFINNSGSLPAGSILVHDGTKFICEQLERFSFADASESQTTNDTYQVKLTASPVVLGGKYRATAMAHIGVTSANKDVEVKLVVDGTGYGEFFTEPEGSADNRFWAARAEMTLTAGAKTIQVEYRNPGTGTAKISNVTMDLVRIGN